MRVQLSKAFITNIYICIQTLPGSLHVASFSRQAGHRFGWALDKIMPLIIKFCSLEDDELREYCLQAFESFVRRCPKEISPFVGDVSTPVPVPCYTITLYHRRCEYTGPSTLLHHNPLP
ncbi:hypothetical protein DPMN_021271 [Dreissena polymorpha]|uniref:Uncharacterized protein n=1 Tax=Dreissena polymorpha TaxID=45954 RepID=A0A9D4NNX3_DREPO|nr:hypothetical protein DPMN_021271 [Dreissena polymorpha]